MCIAVPDTCILAESNQLIKYLSPSNSQTEALKGHGHNQKEVKKGLKSNYSGSRLMSYPWCKYIL